MAAGAGNEHNPRRPDFSNPADVAYEMSQMQSALTLLQSHTSSSIQNLTSAVESMNANVQNVGRKVEEVTRLQVHAESTGKGLERAFEAIANLADKTTEGFEMQRRNEMEWREQHVHRMNEAFAVIRRNEEEWRATHVKENNEIRDRVMRFSGAALIISSIAGLMMGVAMWYSDKLDTYAAQQRAQINDVMHDNGLRIRNMEYYLSQGGNTPDRHYVPK